MAQQDLGCFTVDRFSRWRVGPSGQVQFEVQWKGFEPEDASWEDVQQLYEDVPQLVITFLKKSKDVPAIDHLISSLGV